MSCYADVNIQYSKELEEKIKGINGIRIIPLGNNGEIDDEKFERIEVPDELFPQHKKEYDAHRWVTGEDGILYYYDPIKNPGKWEYYSHGFQIWLNFEGCIKFVVPCGWDISHGYLTFKDIKKWISDNLRDDHIEILSEIVLM